MKTMLHTYTNNNNSISNKNQFNNPQVVYNLLHPSLSKEKREMLIMLALDSELHLMCPPIIVSIGTAIETLIRPAEYYKIALHIGAIATVVVHNHPSSGNPLPSSNDITLTKQLEKIGKLLQIPLLDHVIIGSNAFFSFNLHM